MKSLMLFFQSVLHDMGDVCHIDTTYDLKTVASRFEAEGLSFLTITLPSFGAALELALDQGCVTPALFPGFRFRGGLPVFLRGFLELCFEPNSGRLLDSPSSDSVYCMRQICLVLSKLEVDCSPERVGRAYQRYVECEKEVREADLAESFKDPAYERLCSMVLGELFSKLDAAVYNGDIVPSHGPGATAERLTSNGRWKQTEWTERLEQIFPATEWLVPSFRYSEVLSDLTYLEPGAERPVRVIDVPKTLKTPRIIAIEPACMMFVQQGLLGLFESGIAGINYLAASVNGPSQLPNQEAALIGSRDGSLATLDLSEASDRVSNRHVMHLLRNYPWLSQAISACRSTKADVRGEILPDLAKFASMGSAMTFPMEALVFITVVLYGVEKSLNRPLKRAEVLKLLVTSQVRVFGDDIIVPVAHVGSVVAALKSFGFVVNARKSFWTGGFRESCGKEYYLGDDVSIVRLRSVLPFQRNHGTEIERTVKSRNLFYEAGMWHTVAFLDGILERLIPLPAVSSTSTALGRSSFLVSTWDVWDVAHQSPLVRAAVATRQTPDDNLDDVWALLKFHTLRSGRKPLQDGHLYRAGRPGSVKLKIRWVRPF